MKLIKELLKNLRTLKFDKQDTLLGLLFVVYLLFDLQTPLVLSQLIDSTLGNVVVLVFALSLFYTKNPFVIVLGFVVAYQLIRNSSIHTGSFAMDNHLPSEEKKKQAMAEFNKPRPTTLEEEMVDNIKPMSTGTITNPAYKPVIAENHKATKV